MIGTVINNYVIARKLGSGGMGEVYYAKHNKVNREVAIKILHRHLYLNESIHNRFKNEANALIKLNHPNIVKIFDYVEQENLACLIMEYINGYTLDEYIEKISGPLPSAKATSIICSVLDAVQYAHDSKIFHRDIKPANIMIGSDGNNVRIMDFGIAKLTDSIYFQTTHANTQLGTPFYMSPEQVKGLHYSRISDIYSLGVTLFEMVTGKCPYLDITNLFELQQKIINERLPPTSKYYPDVSKRIQNAILVATEKLPERRFQSCADFKYFLTKSDVPKTPMPPAKAKSQLPQYQQNKKSQALVYAITLISGVIVATTLILMFFQKTSIDNTFIEPDTQNSFAVIDSLNNDSIMQITKTINDDSLKRNTLEQNMQYQNMQRLISYLEMKQKSTNKRLNDNQKAILMDQVRKYNDSISDEKLTMLCRDYFPHLINPPVRKILERDFWVIINEIIGMKNPPLPCKIWVDQESQIERGTLKFQVIQDNQVNSQTDISVKASFLISDPDGSSPVDCHLILIYTRAGNRYLYTEYKLK
jgi:serine/threonine protein kinase